VEITRNWVVPRWLTSLTGFGGSGEYPENLTGGQGLAGGQCVVFFSIFLVFPKKPFILPPWYGLIV
jgi:hypothetical protein